MSLRGSKFVVNVIHYDSILLINILDKNLILIVFSNWFESIRSLLSSTV